MRWISADRPLLPGLAAYIDVPIAVYLLEGSSAQAYLIARALTCIVPVALTPIGWRLWPVVARAADTLSFSAVQAIAARINLGYVLITGALGVLVLWLASQFLRGDQSVQVLHWLLLGQCAPLLFGATGLLMRAFGRDAIIPLLRIGGALCLSVTIVSAHLLKGPADGLLLAQATAAVQLTIAATCALLLTQRGVWPGLTALAQPRIRLR
ncbi:hypothetical protein KDD17_15650 [Sulfitobacter albidus]|uniref:Uncharacterized protein n=1 Tax=Sulfitobacter albidus TaxID=2829501 RepID=A0A975PMJ7_9RHOB|nr:hypothetical protein [Sulfitobacter albidus]QUJ76310.1 hypothetical protein KDD17_15650 [Sulfitobacter albidus]